MRRELNWEGPNSESELNAGQNVRARKVHINCNTRLVMTQMKKLCCNGIHTFTKRVPCHHEYFIGNDKHLLQIPSITAYTNPL
jgi:hypothetical protein